MSEVTVIDAKPAAPVIAGKLNAIQIVEQQIGDFFKQREVAAKAAEQAVANLHAVEGAIQATQRLLGKLKAEAAKAEAPPSGVAGKSEMSATLVDANAAKVE